MKKVTIAVSLFVFVFVFATLQFVAAQESPRPHSPITVTEAWQAVTGELRARGFRENQLPRMEDLELPVAVPARAGRNLHVSSECWDRDSERERFRIECREAGACLPFLAYLRQDSRAQESRGSALVEASSPSCRAESRGRSSSPSSSSSALRAQPSIRAGERAIAVLRETGFRMSARVTCLDRGAPGDIIRVRSEEGHIFRARVAGPALVEALPE